MNFLDKKVEEILKNHPSGEDFFNHLDDMIRGHKSIIDAAWDKLVQWCYDEHLWVNRGIPTFGWNGLILTGAFGRAVFNYMPYEIRKTFEQVILVNGGLRQGDTKAQILVNQIDVDDFILFDDSFYSGTTRNKIEKALKEIRQGCKIIQTAHDKAVTLISKMNDKISEKEEEVKKIQSEIKDIENIKAQANKFVGNLKSILV